MLIRNIKQITKQRLVIILGSLAIICSAGMLLKYVFFKKTVEYITADVTKRDIEDKVLTSGTVKAFKSVKVGAQVSGQLKKLYVALGDRVKQGQLLAEIDPVLAQNSLKDAEARVESLLSQKSAKQALLKQSTLAYQRQVTMVSQGASSRANLESAQAQLKSTTAELASLEAQIKQAKISVDTAKANLGYTKISAPMDGVVVSVTTDEGQTMVSTQTATTILELADIDTMTIKAKISEADVMRVRPGQAVYFTTIGNEEVKYHSKLRTVELSPASTSANPASTSSSSAGDSSSNGGAIYYNGLFDVPNPKHDLKISMTVQVSIILQAAKQALCIPTSVLGNKEKDGSYFVKVLHKNAPEPRKIKIGITDNIYAQVLNGLAIDDKVILGDSLAGGKGDTDRIGAMRVF